MPLQSINDLVPADRNAHEWNSFSNTWRIENESNVPTRKVLQQPPKTFYNLDVEHLQVENIDGLAPPAVVVFNNPIIAITARIFFSIRLQEIDDRTIESIPGLIVNVLIRSHVSQSLFSTTEEAKATHDLAHINS